ncbi:amidase [Pseudomonas tolaasii]|uniref:Amidase n=2 Tax=Pseudomonas tolaasii TaxID=29442 RepID=A0A7Y8DU15_PSETO|nr:amidase family protein [Pseudomonas tolaasii]ARB27209.1 amidase [Pseudomonas tolaasii]KAB0475578.1 amidase [Pseudomonas tolaasii]MBY8942196.1 amidase [Pseudomonas tolaasii]NWC22853.1 amidase [Pseudomonas tolaasii]NWC40021.1 amidase [Pseudomonas tolaasii]
MVIGYGVHSIIRQAMQALVPGAKPVPPGTEYASVRELSDQLARPGGITSADLIHFFLARIGTLNPQLNAVIELNPEALQVALERDRERAAGAVRGPLHGIPVLLKDTLETKNMQTSAGAFGLVGDSAGNDAPIVQRLIEQGAIILGKTNMSELAGFRGGDHPDGWSSRGGQTLNPYKHDADVGGSSSGSAVALAAGFAPVAVGTETSGSIIVPAALNGVVGLKPSVGLLNRNGIIPASRRQDTPGPMARSVYDVALMLNALAGGDAQDPYSLGAPSCVDYVSWLVPAALKGKRIGYPETFAENGEKQPVVNSARFTEVLTVLRGQGAVLVPVDLRLAEASGYKALLLADVKEELNTYLAKRTGLPAKSLSELLRFNEDRDGTESDHQPVLKQVIASTLTPELRETAWSTLIQDFRNSIDEPLHEHNLDVMVSDFETYSYFGVAAAGYPGITVPCGTNEDGLPVSAYFYGTRWSEQILLEVAYGYEQAAQPVTRPVLEMP